MEKILDRYIKELIDTYPSIGDVLNNYEIGCTSCSVGTCKLRDIIEIHGLSEADEYALFSKIAEVVYPAQAVTIPRLPRKAKSNGANKKFSPPMQMLVDEHTNIKMVIAAVQELPELIKTDLSLVKGHIKTVLDFIRNYADKFHHAKEEDLLFKHFDETSDIIATMYKEHEIGRSYVKAAAAGLESGDADAVVQNLISYSTLLKEHIRKEDEILYPWMDRSLTDSQIGHLYAKFFEVETKFGDEPQRLAAFAQSLKNTK